MRREPESGQLDRTKPAAPAVVGLWYVLGPVALIVAVLVLAVWVMSGGRGDTDPVGETPGITGTTGNEDDAERGRHDDTDDEIESRGGR